MNKKKLIDFFAPAAIVIIIFSLLVLFPSFNLAFQDDDWRGIVLPKTEYADGRLFTPYGIQLWFCALLYDLFGFSFSSYYILSFILRIFLSLSVLIFLYNFTKNKFASFLGGLLVAVSFSGLQTTYEIANTNVYIALIGFMIFLAGFILSLNRLSINTSIIIICSLIFTTLASPVRTYPLYFWAFIVDAIGLLIIFSKHRFKIFLLRQLIIFLTFFSLYSLGLFNWFSIDTPSNNRIYDLNIFFSQINLFISNLDFSILLNFLRGLGNIFLPSILDKTGVISIALGSFYIISLFFVFLTLIKKKNEQIYYLFSFLIWPFIFFTSYFIVVLGGYGDAAKDTLVLESYRRYLLPPLIGFSIIVAILLKSIKKKFLQLAVIILIIIHALSTNYFLNDLSKHRDGAFMLKIWNQFKIIVPIESLDQQNTNVFYFETDGSKRAIYTLDDGFILHAATLYKIPQGTVTSSPNEILNFIKLLRHTFSSEQLVTFMKEGFPQDLEQMSWDRVFALKIEGDKLIDIKDDVKKRVEAVWKY